MAGGREIQPSSRFAGDDGGCDPALARALAAVDPTAREAAVVEALAAARLLVPVVATPEGGDDAVSTAVVTVAGVDGRSVLPVFSSVGTLQRWDVGARPVPVEGPRAALAAAVEADGQLVLDPAGPTTVLLGRPAVAALAQGRPWVPALDDLEIHRELADALRSVPGVVGVRGERGRRAELAVVMRVRPGLGRSELDDLARRAGEALASRGVLVDRVDSFELRLVADPGP